MVTIFIERISNQNYDEHPVWQKILDIERCERENDGFVTVFPFHSFLFGIIYIKNYFPVLIGGIKIRLKISIFYGEKVVHLADF